MVELRPLSLADAAHMAAACLADYADRALVDLVSRRCGGLPLLVEELVAVSHDDPIGTLIPPTITAVVDTRLAALSGPTRACIDASAVLGERFDCELLAPRSRDRAGGAAAGPARASARAFLPWAQTAASPSGTR